MLVITAVRVHQHGCLLFAQTAASGGQREREVAASFSAEADEAHLPEYDPAAQRLLLGRPFGRCAGFHSAAGGATWPRGPAHAQANLGRPVWSCRGAHHSNQEEITFHTSVDWFLLFAAVVDGADNKASGSVVDVSGGVFGMAAAVFDVVGERGEAKSGAGEDEAGDGDGERA